ncbi:CLUMA_CG009293, isoform A [Clunio marinus]|uniref:CLUMA_CG009293, isoform A n=1 Tax=Clunio marinus TaxID=568069 RepID=A0A1J1I6C0_9DIPT|nr:CLUMA_CG009293, isoform A [Clunio marinus]
MANTKNPQQSAQEIIYSQFMALRNEQRNLVNNLSTLELDLKEHKTVIDTLKTVDENRKCFRLIGGVLAEQTVKETLPNLIQNRDQLEKLIENGKEQLTKKGVEINKFKEEHNIKVKSENEDVSEPSKDKVEQASSGKSNVLVS